LARARVEVGVGVCGTASLLYQYLHVVWSREHTEQWALEVLKAGADVGPVTVFGRKSIATCEQVIGQSEGRQKSKSSDGGGEAEHFGSRWQE
jgi:hypothetical protein